MRLSRGEIVHHLLRRPVRLYLKSKFNICVENNPLEKLREPYILVGHHVTAFDPVISNAFSGRLIRYVAADANFDNKLKRVFLGLLESIPISKNKSEIRTIHQIRKVLGMNHPVGLYPEGGRNWDGETDIIIPSTAKLVKMMQVPVYAAFYKGGYLSKPRWASHFRKGKVMLEIRKILDKDTIRGKTVEELHELLVKHLSYNEFEWQKRNRVIFKGKRLAEYIERLLYVCPECHGLNTIKSSGNKFSCIACGKEYSINKYGEIEGCSQFTETVSWNRWQRTLLKGILEEGFNFVNSDISLERISMEGTERKTQLVNLIFSQEKLVIRYGDGEDKVINLSELYGISITFLDVVEFFVDEIKYRFTFDPKRHMSVKLFYDLLRTIAEK